MIQVSIIVLTYNSDWKKLCKTIKSAASQKKIDFEIVVCDDGSNAEFVEHLKEYMQTFDSVRYNLIIHKNNVGIVKNYFDGILVAKGKYIYGISPGDYFYNKEIDGKIKKVDLDRQILKPLCGTGTMFCYDSPEYVKDMGTPERFHQVEEDFKKGVVSAKNLKNKQKAIFLDRDGTINNYVGFLRKEEDFELFPGVAEAVKKINESGYLAIVVTNQPVIARGEVTFEGLQTIHNKMETLLGKDGAYFAWNI